ncbi:hypothetical protein Tco_0779212 [Tanacetum coccineum]
MHRTLSAPRKSARLTPPAPVPTTEKADEMILQDMIQTISLYTLGMMNTLFPDTRLEPRSDKESPEVEIVQEKDEETSKDTEERLKGKNVEESRISPIPSPTRSPRNLSTLVSSDTDKLQELTVIWLLICASQEKVHAHGIRKFLAQFEFKSCCLAKGLIMERKTTKEETERLISKAILQECGRMQAQISSQIQNAIDNAIPSLVDTSVRSYMSGHTLHVHQSQVQSSSVQEQQHQLYLAMKVDPLLQQQDIAIWLALQMKFKKTHVPHTACRPSAIRPRDQDDPHDDAHPEGENSAKRQKSSEYGAYVSRESSSGQVNIEEPGPSTSVSQDIMKEISLTIDEAKLKKMADEMLRQRCTSGDEHQYHIDQN